MKSITSCILAAAALLVSSDLQAQVPHLLNYQGRVTVDGVNFNGVGEFKFALVDGGTDTSQQAVALPVVSGGSITAVHVTDGGSGYSDRLPPTVTALDIKGGGTGASFTATVNAGVVTAITVDNGGAGYTSAATIGIDAPAPQIAYQTYWSNSPDSSPADGVPDSAVTLDVDHGLYALMLGDVSRANMATLSAGVFDHQDVRLRVWFDDKTHGGRLLSPDQRITAVGYALVADTVSDGAITASKIADGTITSQQLAADAVEGPNIAPGAVGSSQLALGAVGSSQLAPGAVGASQLAEGAIGPEHLAKPPRSGSLGFSALDLQFNTAKFTVPLSPSFATTPIVTFAARSTSSGLWHPSSWVNSVASSSFSGRLAVPVSSQNVDSEATWAYSFADINGLWGCAHVDSSNILKFSYTGSDQLDWKPKTVAANAEGACSLAMVDGKPAIAYYDPSGGGELIFIRARFASGYLWSNLPNPPVTIDTGDFGDFISMAIINGNPAVAYYDSANGNLKYARAQDAEGATWGTVTTLVTANDRGKYVSLAEVDGRPAMAFYDETDEDLYYVRAMDAVGGLWSAAIAVDGIGSAGRMTSLAVVDGNPAIAYSSNSGPGLYGWCIKYVRASNASGSSWNAPIIVSQGSDKSYPSMAVIGGKPAVSYMDTGTRALVYTRATDASGVSWEEPVTVIDDNLSTGYTELCVVDGIPGIAYIGLTHEGLNFVRAPEWPSDLSIDWIALEP